MSANLLINPMLGWIRLGMCHGERTWLNDVARGAACVIFTQRDIFGYRGGESGETRRRMLAAKQRRDITGEVLRLHRKRWLPKPIGLALDVDNALVYRILKAHREGDAA